MLAESIKKHPVLLNTEEFVDLCSPLQMIDITTFSHAKVNNEGEFALLSNNPEFLINYFDKAYYNVDVHTDKSCDGIAKYLMWNLIDCSGRVRSMVEDAAGYNFKNVFTIIKHDKNGSDFYHFGTHLSDISVYQRYLNYLDLLNLFIQYLDDKVSKSKTLAAVYNTKVKINLNPTHEQIHNIDEVRTNFISATTCKKEKLSKRQLECALLLVEGATAKEIAVKMSLSYRTVEDYIALLKNKLHAKNKSELIVALLNYFNLNS